MDPAPTRRAHIARHVDLARARILEVGALDSPTFRRDDGHCVEYADYASREELSLKGKANPRYEFERLVHVDHIVHGVDYSAAIDARFDVVVANHVIEHVPDTITWLHGLGKVLRPGGIVFLSVPDRRYTFDIVRRETDFIDLLRAHAARKTRPDVIDILDHLWHFKPVKTRDVAAGRHLELAKQMRYTPADALERAVRLAAINYADVHCHVFTEESFRTLVDRLAGFGFLGFGTVDIHPVPPDTNEFHVVLGDFAAERFTAALPAPVE